MSQAVNVFAPGTVNIPAPMSRRQLVRWLLLLHVNDPTFAAAVVRDFHAFGYHRSA